MHCCAGHENGPIKHRRGPTIHPTHHPSCFLSDLQPQLGIRYPSSPPNLLSLFASSPATQPPRPRASVGTPNTPPLCPEPRGTSPAKQIKAHYTLKPTINSVVMINVAGPTTAAAPSLLTPLVLSVKCLKSSKFAAHAWSCSYPNPVTSNDRSNLSFRLTWMGLPSLNAPPPEQSPTSSRQQRSIIHPIPSHPHAHLPWLCKICGSSDLSHPRTPPGPQWGGRGQQVSIVVEFDHHQSLGGVMRHGPHRQQPASLGRAQPHWWRNTGTRG